MNATNTVLRLHFHPYCYYRGTRASTMLRTLYVVNTSTTTTSIEASCHDNINRTLNSENHRASTSTTTTPSSPEEKNDGSSNKTP